MRERGKSQMTITNILLIFVVLVAAGALMYNYIKKKKEAPVEDKITVDDKTYTLDLMEIRRNNKSQFV